MVFTIYGHGGHLGHVTRTIWTNFRSPILRSLHMKFEFNWPSGFRGEDVWKCWRTTDGRRTDGRRTYDGRTTDAGVTGILIAHLGAFGSGELKNNAYCTKCTLCSLHMFCSHNSCLGAWSIQGDGVWMKRPPFQSNPCFTQIHSSAVMHDQGMGLCRTWVGLELWSLRL